MEKVWGSFDGMGFFGEEGVMSGSAGRVSPSGFNLGAGEKVEDLVGVEDWRVRGGRKMRFIKGVWSVGSDLKCRLDVNFCQFYCWGTFGNVLIQLNSIFKYIQ